ncbi:uncharacterized protein RCC_00530 [Ramularia collo-cygni]|uniref:Uncharacterized protein n=1 Tax=Ramularia collo-cygni TaxID=112498 RepID=A0A2D3V2Q3_9PEZI|nr:uncharacterized protein RCC_00530 [Ramularia collo-cygni]CZT14553.1 uncharacterized protein RCC_00530 [Ramularia collo-cygni]
MSAIPFGVVGTNWISDSWIQAAEKTGKWKLHTVYSRSQDQASKFAAKYGCTNTYTSLDEFAADSGMQAVYIASPNSLHYVQAKRFLKAKKHVILEKPATSTVAELDDLFRTAKEEGVYLIEAFRHIQEANFKLLKKSIVQDQKLGKIYGASFTYASYSSRYNNVLAGETPNIFSLEFSGGSLVDIGVYPITFAVALFGRPKAQTYVPAICRTGVDLGGVGILHYDGFGVQINNAKGYNSAAPCEVYGEKGTITINATTDISTISLLDPRTKNSEELAGPCLRVEKPNVNMEEEATEFARVILEKDTHALAELEKVSRDVIHVTTDMRRQGSVVYPADQQ